MISLTKDEIFREMYMGMHWLILLGTGLYQFHVAAQPKISISLLLMLYALYLTAELWLYLNKKMVYVETQLGGCIRTIIDFTVLSLLTQGNPPLFAIFIPVFAIMLLVISFQDSKNHALTHGIIGVVFYVGTAYSVGIGQDTFHPLTVLCQSIVLLFFSFLLAEVNHLFNGVYSRNYHAMEEIAYKNKLLEQAAKTDFLTDMYNHQSFYQALDHVANHAAPISLILLDIDNFKRINDEFGHLTGDYVLREVAQLIKGNIRNADIAARYGGEEFAVLMPTSNQETSFTIAERIRQAIATHKFILEDKVIPVTISGGVGFSSIYLDKLAQSQFVDQVDTLLYEAKRSGKNKIIPQVKEGLNYESHYYESHTLKTELVL